VATVHLLSAAPADGTGQPKAFHDLEQMAEAAQRDRFGAHSAVADPDGADLILFVETSAGAGAYFERVVRHPLYRRSRERCYLFCSSDRIVPVLPGIFASLERRWAWSAWTRSGHYLGVREEGPFAFDPARRASLLFSFVGAGNAHPVRAEIVAIDHERGLVIDSHAERLARERGELEPLAPGAFARRYVDAIQDSAFVLCPRGLGTSTFRLFEAMMLGRVPVVLSDQWVPPNGPDWDAFSIRVPEARVAGLPALLEERERDAAAMGARARQAWLDWFAPDASFHRTVEWCLDLGRSAPARSGLRRYAPYLQMARPYHAARWTRRRFTRDTRAADGRRFGPG
jgi:Exostosin family